MINDNIDFDYAISKIKQGTNTDIYLQPEILNSDYINNSFSQIENTLNTLYEKTRYLEDSIIYAKEFLETRINQFSVEMNAVLHEIENVADVSKAKNLAYISYNVPFVQCTETIADKGNNEIKPLVIKDNKYLTLNNKKSELIKFSSCERNSIYVPYKDNLSAVSAAGQIIKNKDEAYRVVYLEEKLIPEGLSESILIFFESSITINNIDIGVSNCTVKNLEFGLINGEKEIIEEYNIDMPIKKRHCNYIKFDLVCTNYELIVYELDKAYMTDNVWSQAKELEFDTSVDLQTTKFDTSVFISRHNVNRNTKKFFRGRHHNHRKCKKHRHGHSDYEDSIPKYEVDIPKYEVGIPEIDTGYVPDVQDELIELEEEPITTELKMYSYVFGLDSLTITHCEHETDGYMISDPIYIGDLKPGEYIRLDVSHNKFDCNEISYSILDEDIEIPIAIINEEFIENELLFGEGIETRFSMDFDSGRDYVKETVSKDGSVIGITYFDAQKEVSEMLKKAMKEKVEDSQKEINLSRYSVTYKPSNDFFDYKPLHNTIRVKCYIRTMNPQSEQMPYIENIIIKKYGEESLWTNRY